MPVTAKKPIDLPQPQPAKPGKKPKRPKKPMSKGAAVCICIAVFIFLLAGLFACLLTNLLGASDMLISVLPQYKAMAAGLEKREAALLAAQQKVLTDAEKAANEAKANAKAADALKAREEALAAARRALEEDERMAKSAEERRRGVVDIFISLSPSKAASMLQEGYTARQAADMLQLLPTDTASNIIGKMDDAFAAEIAKLMMQ